jgi:hypothetical protein
VPLEEGRAVGRPEGEDGPEVPGARFPDGAGVGRHERGGNMRDHPGHRPGGGQEQVLGVDEVVEAAHVAARDRRRQRVTAAADLVRPEPLGALVELARDQRRELARLRLDARTMAVKKPV